MKDFRDLVVWEKAHKLNLACYKATDQFPRREMFGLTSQVRRCSHSIGANIAEGCGKHGNGEFYRYLDIAAGSSSELEYHLLVARDLGFLPETAYAGLHHDVVEVKRMLASLIRKVANERAAAKG